MASEVRAPGHEEGAGGDLGPEDKDHAHAAVTAFQAIYEAKFPKAVTKITDDLDQLLTFYDYPRSTGCICGLPTRSSRPLPPCATGPGPPGDRGRGAAGLAMAFKLIEAAQDRWRAVSAPHLIALVRAGAVVCDGVLIERPELAAA